MPARKTYLFRRSPSYNFSMQRNEVVTQDHPAAALFPTAAARRMARCRARRREGLRCVLILLREAEVDVLVQRGRLSNEERANPAAVRKAVHGFLDDYLR